MLWLDLDHFKTINDRYGHAEGDQALRQLSRLLETSVRLVDTVSRYGGEEFLVVLPELAMVEAREMAERLLEAVQEETVTLAEGDTLHLSVSIGLAVFPRHGQNLEELCVAADNAMYEAKRLGRNRVCVAEEPKPDPVPE